MRATLCERTLRVKQEGENWEENAEQHLDDVTPSLPRNHCPFFYRWQQTRAVTLFEQFNNWTQQHPFGNIPSQGYVKIVPYKARKALTNLRKRKAINSELTKNTAQLVLFFLL